MDQARSDGAPKGTPFACYVCGYDTRWNTDGTQGEAKGEYTPKIGVKHKTTQECMTMINHFVDHRLYLDRPRHREDAR